MTKAKESKIALLLKIRYNKVTLRHVVQKGLAIKETGTSLMKAFSRKLSPIKNNKINVYLSQNQNFL